MKDGYKMLLVLAIVVVPPAASFVLGLTLALKLTEDMK